MSAIDLEAVSRILSEPKSPADEGRFQLLFVDEHSLQEIFRRVLENDDGCSPQFFVRCNYAEPLPADAKVCGVAYDFSLRGFLVRIASAEYEPVPSGMMPPEVDRNLRRARTVKNETWLPKKAEAIAAARLGDLARRAKLGHRFKPEEIEQGKRDAKHFTDLLQSALDDFSASHDARKAAAVTGIPVSLPPVTKSWEGKEAKDAPGQEAEAEQFDGSFVAEGRDELTGKRFYGRGRTEAEARENLKRSYEAWRLAVSHDPRIEVDAPKLTPAQREAGLAEHFPLPVKSESRLALEYDLRQRLHPAEGSELDRAISGQTDGVLSAAMGYENPGNSRDCLLRAK